MIKNRKETWGKIMYDTKSHSFSYKLKDEKIENRPYATRPLVLNVDLTFKCNMLCTHCVAMDMARLLGGTNNADLIVTDSLIKKINCSPFLAIVITGGEPFLPELNKNLKKLIDGIDNKGIIIDTNGTIFPPSDLLKIIKQKDILLRVSWDIPAPKYESIYRKYPKKLYKNNEDQLKAKEQFIHSMFKRGIKVAVQTVLHKYNYNNNNFKNFPYKLKQLNIKDWYIQRFIPSHHAKNDNVVDIKEYERRLDAFALIAKKQHINCHYKKDRRHNSVFLLVKDGDIYTQSDKEAGKKLYLGKIEEIDYFFLVSPADHTARYLI